MSTAVLSRVPRGVARAPRHLHSRLPTPHVPDQLLYIIPLPEEAYLFLVADSAAASPIRTLAGDAAPGTTYMGPRTGHGRRVAAPLCVVNPLLPLCLIAPVPRNHDNRKQPSSPQC